MLKFVHECTQGMTMMGHKLYIVIGLKVLNAEMECNYLLILQQLAPTSAGVSDTAHHSHLGDKLCSPPQMLISKYKEGSYAD